MSVLDHLQLQPLMATSHCLFNVREDGGFLYEMMLQEFLLQAVVQTTEEYLDIFSLHIGEKYPQFRYSIRVYDGHIAETKDEDLVACI